MHINLKEVGRFWDERIADLRSGRAPKNMIQAVKESKKVELWLADDHNTKHEAVNRLEEIKREQEEIANQYAQRNIAGAEFNDRRYKKLMLERLGLPLARGKPSLFYWWEIIRDQHPELAAGGTDEQHGLTSE